MNSAAASATPAVFPISLLCLSNSWGGLELNTVRFADWMRQRGWPVQTITLANSPIATRAAELSLPLATLHNPWKAADMPAARRLADLLRGFGTRVLIITRNGDLGLAVLCKTFRLPQLRLVYQQHMQLGLAKRGLLHTLRYRALDAWLSPLPGLARQVLEKTRLAAEKLHVVPLGIELEKFAQPGFSQAEARQQLGLILPDGVVLLGLIGRFDDGKGQDFVVEALGKMREKHPQLQVLFVGEPTRNEGNAYREAVQKRVQALSLTEVVHVREFMLKPEVAYRALDISITASVNETYGMVTIEAMATGLPVVASATGGTLEIVRDGSTGLLFPLRDEAAFVAAVEQLLASPELAQRLGKQARQEALATYSHHRQCELTENVLRALI
ncbi:glycosyltransferase involved in cell wall biosynthesis [Hymenobacter luteus]|uniref:Glycosyltransferase involved in cell wall biosynthesis n=2 Tax=Hymenobacter TaxID=89966 RepID=A0A7W9WBG8_9BACT|nr:glycosyltransferase family 4 protein [Hymenobacter latericoloratus]MBB4601467.1 glycosyltransferase involved in cell wall biosynthesis [Hymenobacter latericoloratus]MBB6058326.1 glycosyltransferase involved in cell wall biosynthesis [Hymenobacter luteus]